MDEEPLIQVEGVGKKFCRSLKKSLWYGVLDMAGEVTGGGSHAQLRPDEFWAVQDVSFQLRRGECLGLIGRNGAGKTTLLKMLNGLIKPDCGRITMRGRVGSLIALGAGFNPILTGRENVYVNASVLGLAKKETDAKMEEIIDFAGLREFIDAPVQSYSSGMQVRLGFAVATALEPDILILDEVLAVGDAAFRNKCYARIGKLKRNAAVILVSHDMSQVARICHSALMLERGRVTHWGEAKKGVEQYYSCNDTSGVAEESFEKIEPPLTAATVEIGPEVCAAGGFLTARLTLTAQAPVANAALHLVFYNFQEQLSAEWNSQRNGMKIDLVPGLNHLTLNVGPLHLMSGTYKLGLGIYDATGVAMILWSYKKNSVRITGPAGGLASYQIPSA